MDREDLKRHLKSMQQGEVYILPYDIYEGIFEQGQSDQAGREECDRLARDCGCTAEISAMDRQVRFAKDA